MESCSGLSSDGGDDLQHRTEFSSTERQENRHRRRTSTERKEFPPSLSILSQTEQTPWVLRRYHTDDGRLILREERAPRQGYFEASRSNGRLRLQLFLVEDAVYEEEEEECEETAAFDEEEGTGMEKGISAGGGVGILGGKCMDHYYSPCFLRMSVLPIRTVHI